LTWEEIVSRWPHVAERGVTVAKRYAPPDGETFDAVSKRVADALNDLQQGDLERVLIVTHAGPLHAMLHAVFGDRLADMEQVAGLRFSPAGITRLLLEHDGAEIVALNDVAHLL
jgi:broad specificity phosphatase PhoE